MRLTCPNCDAHYEVEDSAIPRTGRDVQCSNCGHAWFQTHPDTDQDHGAETALHGDAPADAVAEDPVAAQATLTPDTLEMDGDVPVDDDAPIGRSPRRIDENVLAVLREEAARETEVRRRETVTLETQSDLGLAPVDPPSAMVPTGERAQRQRDLLPDIEEINSTLRPGADSRGDGANEVEEVTAQRRSGFRTGFLLVVAVALVLAALYIAAPKIGAAVPALAAPMAAYVAAVDTFRLWLDGAVQGVVGALRSLSGQPG